MTDPERLLADTLSNAGVETESERVSAAFADERIAEKIGRFSQTHQREGMAALDKTLREHEIPPNVRLVVVARRQRRREGGPQSVGLHLITAVAHLGRIAEESLEERKARTRP